MIYIPLTVHWVSGYLKDADFMDIRDYKVFVIAPDRWIKILYQTKGSSCALSCEISWDWALSVHWEGNSNAKFFNEIEMR